MEVKKASKNGNKEEKFKLEIMKEKKERSELRKEHMWQCAFSHARQCAFSHAPVPISILSFRDIIVILLISLFQGLIALTLTE